MAVLHQNAGGWQNTRLNDSANLRSIIWDTRLAYDAAQVPSIDWGNRALFDSSTSSSVDWQNRQAFGINLDRSIDWGSRIAYDLSEITSIDWANRQLTDPYGSPAVDWQDRILKDSYGDSCIYWDAINNGYKITQNNYIETKLVIEDQENLSSAVINSVEWNGAGEKITVDERIDPTVAIGDLVSLGEDGIWYQTDQTSISGSCMLGICIESNPKGIVFTEGTITVVTDVGFSNIPFVEGTSFYGKPVYMRSGSIAGLSTTLPTTGYVRNVGHLYYNNTSDTKYWLMKFRPSNDWYVI
jgi:hypothetical protein